MENHVNSWQVKGHIILSGESKNIWVKETSVSIF